MFYDVNAICEVSKPADRMTAEDIAEIETFFAYVEEKRERFATWSDALDVRASGIPEPKQPNEDTLAILIERGVLHAPQFSTVGNEPGDDAPQEVSA